MISRLVTLALVAAGWAVFLLAFVWPTLALILSSVAQGQWPADGFVFPWRQWGLLWRSGWLSTAATVVCVLVSLPGAYLIGQTRRVAHRPLLAACPFMVLLCPPMVYAFGWDRILPTGFDPDVRCIGTWALWAWPIPALVIGAAWSRAGHRAFEAALLSTSRASAFLHAAVPALLPHIALSSLVLFVVFFGDYGVPHACGLTVYTTELLGWATSSSRTIDVLWPATLPSIVTILVLLAMVRVWRGCAAAEPAEGAAHRSPLLLPGFVVLAILIVSWLLPMGALVAKLASPTILVEALRIYAPDLACSLAVAMVSGVAAVAMGFGVVMGTNRWHGLPARGTTGRMPVPQVWAMIFGALPGALIGESLVAAYNRPAFGWFYDHWPILVLAYVGRFGWIGLLVALLVTHHREDDLPAQARTDGATEMDILSHLVIPMNWALLSAGVAVVAALSVAEVAASSMVRVPGFNPIAHVVIEKFHRFEDGMLISLSLCLVAVAIPPALLLAWGLRRRT